MFKGSSDTGGERLGYRVYGQLLAFIMEQGLDHGDRLPSEHKLSSLMAVSRPMVREALMRLQADGLVETRRGSGSFVRQRPTEGQVHHLLPARVREWIESFEVRIALEPVAARLAAQNRSEAELETIKRAMDQQHAALAAGAPAGACDYALHKAIAAATHNPFFELTLSSLHAGLAGLIVPSLSLLGEEHEQRAQVLEFEHTAIAEAIERGEAEAAEAAMRLHLLRARRRATSMRW